MPTRGRRRPRRGVAVLALVAVTAPLACGGDGAGNRDTSGANGAARPTTSTSGSTTWSPATPSTARPPTTAAPTPPPTAGTLTTTSTKPPPEEVAPGGSDPATRLSASPACEGTPPRGIVRMRWQPSGAGRQRVDVTVLDNGFQPGTFDSSQLLGAGQSSLDWDRSHGEATHYWRVITEVGGRWVGSETATFEGPGCVGVDVQPR